MMLELKGISLVEGRNNELLLRDVWQERMGYFCLMKRPVRWIIPASRSFRKLLKMLVTLALLLQLLIGLVPLQGVIVFMC